MKMIKSVRIGRTISDIVIETRMLKPMKIWIY